jgi:hypothetical protein
MSKGGVLCVLMKTEYKEFLLYPLLEALEGGCSVGYLNKMTQINVGRMSNY